MADFLYQYDLVKSSRLVLLDFCRTLSADHFVQEHAHFGRGSIRNLLVHVANVYEFWIGSKALKLNQEYTPLDAVTDMDQMVLLYDKIDRLIGAFASSFGDSAMKPISFERDGLATSETPFKLFTHVITHEYHHKGQVLSMSRHLGYVPVDTDVIR